MTVDWSPVHCVLAFPAIIGYSPQNTDRGSDYENGGE